MSPRRLAILLPHLRPGGAETVMVRIANGLLARGMTVDLVAVSGAGSLGDAVDSGIRLHVLGRERVRHALPALVRCLRHLRPDVAMATLGRLNILLAAARPLLGGIRLIGREANTPSVDLVQGRHGLLTRRLYPVLYPTLDRIVCQSDAMRADMRDTLRIPDERLVRIYNPAPVREIERRLAEADNPFAPHVRPVVACGRLSAQKGFDVLLEAFATVHAEVGDARLFLLGEGELRQALERQARSLGLGPDVVTFCGYREDRFRYFRHAEVVVSSSRWEGLPNVVLESIVCGTPVVATDCPGGTREIVQDGRNGWLVPVDDCPALSRAIRNQLAGKTELAREAMLETIAPFSEEVVFDQYARLVDEVARPRP